MEQDATEFKKEDDKETQNYQYDTDGNSQFGMEGKAFVYSPDPVDDVMDNIESDAAEQDQAEYREIDQRIRSKVL